MNDPLSIKDAAFALEGVLIMLKLFQKDAIRKHGPPGCMGCNGLIGHSLECSLMSISDDANFKRAESFLKKYHEDQREKTN